MRPRSRRRFLQAVGVSGVGGLSGCIFGDAGSTDDLDRVRDHLSRYDAVADAVADGFEMATPYIHTPDGSLGLPFIRYGAPDLAPEEPNVLFYQLHEDGTYRLLGAKWLVRAADTDGPPSLFGQEFIGPIADETGSIDEHYALHAWLFAENPDGTFHRYHTGVEPPSFLEDLETTWAALNPYYSNEALAEEDGYARTEGCIETDAGGYAIPFVNPERTGADPTAPAVLLYRFSSNWNYRLVGAEWYVPATDADNAPSLFGQSFHDPMSGHSPQTDQPEHYGLHAWIFTANPDGMFAPFNALIGC